MRLCKYLFLACILAFSVPLVAMAADEAASEKVAVADLPAAVTAGFTKEVPMGEITSAKKLGGDKAGEKVRYQIHYKLEGKEHQITLSEEGARTQKKKDEKESDSK